MIEVFLKILNMSFVASLLILAVILLRLALKQAPKWITCLLWGMVAVRLLCPVSLESSLSLISNAEPITHDILMVEPPDMYEEPAFNPVVNPILPDVTPVMPDTSIDQTQIKTMLATFVWVIGMGVMLAYAAFSYLHLHYKVRVSLHLRDNIWLCDEIATPFLLGVLRPKIYIPSGVEEQHLPHIIAHENAHLKRRDHWWKPLGFLVLAVHWFNPLVWIAYTLLGRDIELACDEKVVRDLDKRESVAYSEALLSCSLGRRTVLVCPLAFGEVGVKERVNRVLQYKKPTTLAVILASAVCVVIAVCFLTNPNEDIQSQNQDIDATSELVLETFPDDGFSISVDTSIWTEGSLDSEIYHWRGEDEDNFVEVGHMSTKPDIDQMIQLTLQRNGIEEMEIIEIPKDTPFIYAVAIEKENGYRLELYFTDKLQDETYFWVACCYNPINDQMRDSTHELSFSFAMVENENISERVDSDIEYAENDVPTEEDVLAARQQATEGMSQQQVENLTEVIKTANLWLEHRYMYENIFEVLSDPNNLYWNYFHQTGEIQIGWGVDGSIDIDAVCEREKLSLEEFYAKYGMPVVATNLYDADGFIDLLSEMKSFVQNEDLKSELQYLMDQSEQAKETHRMEIVNNIYKKLHDLDYFLLRYGPKDVAKYVKDDSTVSKYYGTLSFYQ